MSFRNIFSFLETSTVKCGLWWEKAGLRRLQLSMNTVPLPGGSTGAGAVGWEESFPHEEVTGLLLLLCIHFSGRKHAWQGVNQCSCKVHNLFLKPLNRPSVQFSRSVMSDSWWPHGLQHARLPCLSPTPEFTQTHVHWLSDAIQPSHPLLFPSPAFSLSQHQGLFLWVSSSYQVAKVLVSVSAPVLPMNIQDWFPLNGLVGSPCSPRDLKSLQHHSSEVSILRHSTFFIVQFSHPYMTTGKIIALTRRTFVGK